MSSDDWPEDIVYRADLDYLAERVDRLERAVERLLAGAEPLRGKHHDRRDPPTDHERRAGAERPQSGHRSPPHCLRLWRMREARRRRGWVCPAGYEPPRPAVRPLRCVQHLEHDRPGDLVTAGSAVRWHGSRPCERPSRFAAARTRMRLLAIVRPEFDAMVAAEFDRAVLYGTTARPPTEEPG